MKKKIETGLDGCFVEPQPTFGTEEGGVLHMLPGGTENPDWFGGEMRDVYAFYAKGKHGRGGHYHLELDELFFAASGSALWILSDFREDSPTFGKTVGLILGAESPSETHDLPSFTRDELGGLCCLRVPAGIYHAVFPIDEKGFLNIALGTTPFDKEDYRYPKPKEVPRMKELLDLFDIPLPESPNV